MLATMPHVFLRILALVLAPIISSLVPNIPPRQSPKIPKAATLSTVAFHDSFNFG